MEADHRKVEKMVPKRFHKWLKVFGKVESERMLVRKVWDHAIDLKVSKARVYPLSRNEKEKVQKFVDEHLKKGYIRSSKSPQMLLVFFVSKKDGGKYMVMDSYISKSLNETECNYEIHNKEMLAVIQYFQAWRHFLEGTKNKFEVWTDHKNLEYFMSNQKLNCQQA